MWQNCEERSLDSRRGHSSCFLYPRTWTLQLEGCSSKHWFVSMHIFVCTYIYIYRHSCMHDVCISLYLIWSGLLRCSKSCRLRWTNYLRPGIKRGNFTDQEEKLIIHLQALLGNRWSLLLVHLHHTIYDPFLLVFKYWHGLYIDLVLKLYKKVNAMYVDGQQ